MTGGVLAFQGASWLNSIPKVINTSSWSHILQPKHGLTKEIVQDFTKHICQDAYFSHVVPAGKGHILEYKAGNMVAKVFEHPSGERVLSNAWCPFDKELNIPIPTKPHLGDLSSSFAMSAGLHGMVLGTTQAMKEAPAGAEMTAIMGGICGGSAALGGTVLILSSNPISLPASAAVGFIAGGAGSYIGGKTMVFLTHEPLGKIALPHTPDELAQKMQFVGIFDSIEPAMIPLQMDMPSIRRYDSTADMIKHLLDDRAQRLPPHLGRQLALKYGTLNSREVAAEIGSHAVSAALMSGLEEAYRSGDCRSGLSKAVNVGATVAVNTAANTALNAAFNAGFQALFGGGRR